MKGSGGAAAMNFRIDPAEEARHREVMEAVGVYDVQWALSKVLEKSDIQPGQNRLLDIQPGQNRLLLTKDMVRAGHIPTLFPELEEVGEDGQNAQRKVSVRVLDAEGRDKEVNLRYLNSIKSYRVLGPEWRALVQDSRMCKGDRLDLYTCRRGGGDGERCLFSFTTKGWAASAAWCTKVRKRFRQQPPDGDNGDVDYNRAKRDHKREDHMVFVTNHDDDRVHAWTGCYKDAERIRQVKSSSVDLNAIPDETEAAITLLMLKYGAFYAEHY